MTDSVQSISLVAAFSAGLLSFVSPCVLPLVPSYISYITGLSIEQLTDVSRTKPVSKSHHSQLPALYRGVSQRCSLLSGPRPAC